MENLEALSRELERRGKADAIKRLADSQQGRSLAAMIDPEKVELAARSGDAAALKSMLGSILETKEGRALAENVKKLLEG